MTDVEKFVQKIEDAKTLLPKEHKDAEWMDGFNAGLEWARRIITGDKSAS